MAKKKNKKFKKSPALNKPQMTNEIGDTVQILGVNEAQVSAVRPEKVKDEYDISILNEKYLPIRKDVFKLMIVLASLAVIFIAIYMVGTKTQILTNVGDWLYKLSNIQTQ